MAPVRGRLLTLRHFRSDSIQPTLLRRTTGDWRANATAEEFIVESWSEGFMVGALLIMACITIANMRRGVLLHKFILAEQLLALTHGTFCFMSFHGYDWYLSATATLLYLSWILHNVVAWMKVRPFFSQPGGFFKAELGLWITRIYLGTLALTVPVIIFQISDNFRFFNNRGGWYIQVRPYEPLMRDPWWVFTCIILFVIICRCYGTGVLELIRRSPRFGILLSAIILAMVFTILDIVASIPHVRLGPSKTGTDGINPWWKLSLVFKCLTDTIMLDDFKTELKRLGIKRIAKEEKRRNSVALVADTNYLSPFGGGDEADDDASSEEKLKPMWYGAQNRSSERSLDTSPNLSPTATRSKMNTTNENLINTEPLNDPSAGMEEVEFSTALALDPSRLSGVASINGREDAEQTSSGSNRQQKKHGKNHSPHRRSLEKESVNDHTKRIARLPGLKELKFEAIKPGKKTTPSPKTDDEAQVNRIEDHTEDVDTNLPPAMSEMEMQKFAAAGGGGDGSSGSNNIDTTPKPPQHIEQNNDQGGVMTQLKSLKAKNHKESKGAMERRQRERRFRMSIGALSDD